MAHDTPMSTAGKSILAGLHDALAYAQVIPHGDRPIRYKCLRLSMSKPFGSALA